VDPAVSRRRTSGAIFLLICAPCFGGFLVFVLPAVAGAVVGSLLLPSIVGGAVGASLGVSYMAWRRRKRAIEAAHGGAPATPPSATLNPSQHGQAPR
jgi:hypothetical protein